MPDVQLEEPLTDEPAELLVNSHRNDQEPLFALEIVWSEEGEERTASQARRELAFLESGGLN